MNRRILTFGISTLGIILLVYNLVFFVQEGTRLHSWFGSGSPRGVLDTPDGGTTFVFSVVDSSDFAEAPYPSVGDTLVSADGIPINSLDAIGEFFTDSPNEKLSITYLHAGVEKTTTVITRPPDRRLTIYLPLLQILRFLISLSYLLVGLWALKQRPDSGGVRALALFTFSMASLMIGGVRVTELDFIDPQFGIPLQAAFTVGLRVFGLFFGAFWLHLQLLFPSIHPGLTRHSSFKQTVIYAPVIIAFGASFALGQSSALLMIVVITALITTGMVILGTRRAKAKSSVERRQLSLVYFGSGIGLCGLFVQLLAAIIPGLYQQLPTIVRMVLPILVFTALLASPLSFAYAFSRYRLLEVEARFRRGTRFILITLILILIFGAVVIMISHLVLDLFRIDSRTPTVVLAIMLSLVFSPAHRRARTLIEKKLYPERFRLRDILNEFLMSTSALSNRDEFWNSLEDNLVGGLGIESLIVVEYDPDSRTFTDRNRRPVPIDDTGSFIQTLQYETRAVFMDEISDSDQILLSTLEASWLYATDIHLILPMIVHQRLVGFLGLRFQTEEQDLAAEDLGLIVNLVSRIAIESENLRLLEESIEKQRLKEQLDMARSVQERFLPRELPSVAGLHLAARCQSSLEVAGDYYDIFPIDANRSLLAIGDVSGKGAGAAMLMANLRASIRTISAVSSDLPAMVARLNELLHQDTSPDQFISFFVTIYDARSMEFRYVNAGHNSPRIIRSSGETVALESTGLVLGAFPDSLYAQRTIAAHNSDLIFMFTDGVTEAMNSKDEEFGEERITQIVTSNRTAPPQKLVELIHHNVIEHTNNELFADDFTLLIAKITGLAS